MILAVMAASAVDAALPPRLVFCMGGGLLTQLQAVLPPARAPHSAVLSSVRLCCTTSVVVEGFGDLGVQCAALGGGALLPMIFPVILATLCSLADLSASMSSCKTCTLVSSLMQCITRCASRLQLTRGVCLCSCRSSRRV
jgi:hypothetical protein